MGNNNNASKTNNSSINSNSVVAQDSIHVENEYLLNLGKQIRQEIADNESKIEDYEDLSTDMFTNIFEREEIDLFKRNEQLQNGLKLIGQQQANLLNIDYLRNEIQDGNSEAKVMLNDVLRDKEKISTELKKLGFD